MICDFQYRKKETYVAVRLWVGAVCELLSSEDFDLYDEIADADDIDDDVDGEQNDNERV